MRIVISEFMDRPAVDQLTSRFDVHYDKDLVDRPAELAARVADAHALIVRNRTRVDAALLSAAPKLHVVGRLGVGLDNVDIETCAIRGIAVIPAAGANAQAVAEYVIAAAMLLLRGAYFATADVAAGRWPRAALSGGRELAGRTLGLIGFGGIGRLTGRLARALGMQTIASDPQLPAASPAWAEEATRACALDELLQQADVVSLHVPLAAATRNLMNPQRLATMKPDALLINTSRGGVVDEAALARALREGRLGGAALDVFEREPLAAASPLAGCPNLLLTPHIAGVTRDSNERVSSLIASKVAAALTAA